MLAPFVMISCCCRALPEQTFTVEKLCDPFTVVPAPEDEPEVELPQLQCLPIHGLHKVWHIPSMQLINIKAITHNSIAIKNAKTSAIPVASIFKSGNIYFPQSNSIYMK